MTDTEWNQALWKVGWRVAHKAHFFKRLKQETRGGAFGLVTPNDLARALRQGYTVPADNGALARICVGGRVTVYFRGNAFITVSGEHRRQ